MKAIVWTKYGPPDGLQLLVLLNMRLLKPKNTILSCDTAEQVEAGNKKGNVVITVEQKNVK